MRAVGPATVTDCVGQLPGGLGAHSKPILRKDDFMFLNRSELYRRALGAAMELPKLQAEYGLSSEDLNHVVHMMGFPLPIDLHFSMFVTTIRGQGTEEQVAHWLPKAMNFGILGTYAQTEVRSRPGHQHVPRRAASGPNTAAGSRAVHATVAIRHRWATAPSCAAWRRSPCTTRTRASLTSTAPRTRPSSGGQGAPRRERPAGPAEPTVGGAHRRWRTPAPPCGCRGRRGLGKSATHCILMARLFLHGKDYGPHPFIIQLRSLETHHPLPGVELGDIGPKVTPLAAKSVLGMPRVAREGPSDRNHANASRPPPTSTSSATTRSTTAISV